MSFDCPLGMQKNTLLQVFSYLNEKDIQSFTLCEKKNYFFYKNNKSSILFNFFKERLVNDPIAWLYLNNATKKNPLLQKALIAFTDNGVILKQENGYPILQDLMNDYDQYVIIKKNFINNKYEIKNIKNNTNKVYPDKIKNGKVYFRAGDNLRFNEMRIYDINKKETITLEKYKNKKNNEYYTFCNNCKLDQKKNRLYVGLYPSNQESTTVAISWNLSTGKIFKKFKVSFGGTKCECLMLDNNKLYVAFNRKITVFDAETGKILHLAVEVDDIFWTSNLLKKINNHLIVIPENFIPSDVKILETENLTCVQEFKKNNFFFGNKPISGNYMILTSDNINYIYDVSNIKEIKKIGSFDAITNGSNIKVLGKHIFILDSYTATVCKVENEKNAIHFVQQTQYLQLVLQGGYESFIRKGKLYIKDYTASN